MEIDFEKLGGLAPAIIQDAVTKNVLMLGFMNQEAYDKTIATKKVTFWSRSRNCLWTKGETSGNFLNLVSIQNDCDNDTLLVEIAGREHIFSLFIATSYCQLVVLYGGSAENFVLPIRTGT